MTGKLMGLLGAAAWLCAAPGGRAMAQGDFVVFAGPEAVSFERMLDELAKADVVFVGEEHDHARGHELELAVLQGMQARVPSVALSLEMFERDVQLALDEYLSGQITETHFLQSARPWPNYKTDYRPLVEFCKEKGLPVIAANAPRRYVNIVSRKGQAALRDLPKASRAYLAPLPVRPEVPEGYDRMLSELFGSAHGQGAPAGMMPSAEQMKEAQYLWDATMADSILKFRRTHRGVKVVQMNGAGHSDSRWGIVDRLHRADPRLKIAVVSIKRDPAYPNQPAGKYEGVADYLILTSPGAPLSP